MRSRLLSTRSTYLFLFLLAAPLVAQTPSTSTSEAEAPRFKAPEHPITPEQMQTYFKVCHIPSVSRGLTHEKMEAERKQLPEWYPPAVWDEIEDAIDKMDLPEVALPVYQKYMSTERAAFLIQLFSLPEGRQIVSAMVDAMVRAQHAGATPEESHKLALTYISPEENRETAHLVNKMSPAEKEKLEAHYSDLKKMQPMLAQLQRDYSLAVIDKQTQLIKEITEKHQADLREAKRNFNAGR